MNTREAIQLTIDMGDVVAMMYLGDLTDADLMTRPHPGCNHINWQVGHLILSEHQLINKVAPDAMPALPAGFAEKYSKETTSSNDASAFATKDELLQAYRQQRAATLAELNKLNDEDFSKTTGVDYAPTVGAMFALQGSHWLMHAGQWVIVRRAVGRPVLI